MRRLCVMFIETRVILVSVVLFFPATLFLTSNTRAGETSRVSLADDGQQARDGNSNIAALSADGRFVAFESSAWNLVPGDGNGSRDVFVRDRATLHTERVSVSSAGAEDYFPSTHPCISTDGRFVAFESQAMNLVSPPTTFARTHVYLRDRFAGTTVLVSETAGGQEGNSHSYRPAITPDGRYIVFESQATNLVDPPTNGRRHILRYDRTSGEIILVSRADDGSQAGASCYHPSVSADGNLVVFHTMAALEARDDTGNQDIYIRDIAGGTTKLISLSYDSAHSGNLHSYDPVVSADGWKVAFHSDASNLIDDVWNGNTHVYVRDRHGGGSTYRASVDAAGSQGNGASVHAAINGDGSMVAFESAAANLVPGDGNGWSDIFIHLETPAATYRVSVPDDALGDPEGDGWSWYPSISADGLLVAFESWSTDLVSGDTNGFADIFLRIVATGTAVREVSGGQSGGRIVAVTPNPMRPRSGADIRLDFAHAVHARLEIFDADGRRLTTVADREFGPGAASLRWEGRDARGRLVAPGVYYVSLDAEGRSSASRVLIVP